MRINKYLAQCDIGSRRSVEQFIKEDRVRVNGEPAFLYTEVNPGDIVTLDDKVITLNEDKIYILFNKPKGVVVTSSSKEKHNIIDYINYPSRIFPIGRLDKDSRGLIVLTNDGDIVNKALRHTYKHAKEYLVTIDHPLTETFLQALRNGVNIYHPTLKKMIKTAPCKVLKVSDTKFKITLSQGYNRQIRRMCEAYDYQVKDLVRIRFMNLKDPDLKEGQWRPLTPKEQKDFLDQLK